MTPVTQTRFGPEGNCFMAAIASILEITLEDCPDIYDLCKGDEKRIERDWWKIANDFTRGKGFLLVYIDPQWGTPKGYSVISGMASRGWIHSCVALDGEVVHDPHPSRQGLVDIRDYIVLMPLVRVVGPFSPESPRIGALTEGE